MTVRKRVRAHGRVQGVFFRDSVRRQALDAGVSGWVENRPDGAVEAIFEGDQEAVRRTVEFCRRGPPRAKVLDVECFDEAPEGISGFGVR